MKWRRLHRSPGDRGALGTSWCRGRWRRTTLPDTRHAEGGASGVDRHARLTARTPRARPRMRLYHRTADAVAAAVLQSGFIDASGHYMTPNLDRDPESQQAALTVVVQDWLTEGQVKPRIHWKDKTPS